MVLSYEPSASSLRKLGMGLSFVAYEALIVEIDPRYNPIKTGGGYLDIGQL